MERQLPNVHAAAPRWVLKVLGAWSIIRGFCTPLKRYTSGLSSDSSRWMLWLPAAELILGALGEAM